MLRDNYTEIINGNKRLSCAKLTKDIRDDLKVKLLRLRFPDSLRVIISESINNSLSRMNARIDHQKICSYPDCNCPFDASADPNWCARGYKKHKNKQAKRCQHTAVERTKF